MLSAQHNTAMLTKLKAAICVLTTSDQLPSHITIINKSLTDESSVLYKADKQNAARTLSLYVFL
jgi:hypothetical protein